MAIKKNIPGSGKIIRGLEERILNTLPTCPAQELRYLVQSYCELAKTVSDAGAEERSGECGVVILPKAEEPVMPAGASPPRSGGELCNR